MTFLCRSRWGLGFLFVLIIASCSTDKKKDRSDYGATPKLEIFVDSLDLAQLGQLREAAIATGIMGEETKQKFPCVIEFEGKHLSGHLRFKGDWTDHLENEKWSFRIELNDGGTVFGKTTFSIQHPATRGYGQEWLMHQLLAKHEVLSTHYTFVPVKINGKDFGLYAFEEHFEKQLLESQNRREGVILKFDESLFWEARKLQKADSSKSYFPEFEACYVSPFKEKKTLHSPSLNAQFQLGNRLCEMYRSLNPDIWDYLDVKRAAEYYAWITIGNSAHGMAWHNQRWYVNPVTARLEPIGYDCYGGPEKSTETNLVFQNMMGMDAQAPVSLAQYFRSFLFTVPAFQTEYINALIRITEPNYLQNALAELQPEIQTTNDLLKVEFSEWTIDTTFLMKNARVARKSIPEFKQWLSDGLPKVKPDTSNRRPLINPAWTAKIPVMSYEEGAKTFVVENSGGTAISVVGYKSKSTKKMVPLKPNPVLGTTHWQHDRSPIQLGEAASAIYYQLAGDTVIRKTSELKWPVPVAGSPRIDLRVNGLASFKFIEQKDKQLIIRKGTYSLDRILFIPKGYELTIEAGVKLSLNKGAGILSESPVNMIGTEYEPIQISATDQDNNGFTLLQTGGVSALQHVQFKGLNNLHYEGWTLTGGVNCYESEIKMSHCRISDNSCEDALNIIRSKFELESCSIENTFADGFDSDFCTGEVKNCRFINIGNDGMDFSGSQVTVSDCVVKNAHDKGISCGERSSIEIQNLMVDGSKIGVAAKDRSLAKITKIRLSNCEFGFAAYTKKTEFGCAAIEVTDLKTTDVEEQADIEFGSSFSLDGKLIKGEKYSNISKY